MEEKYGFRIGDKVVLVEPDPCNCVSVGDVGIICHFVRSSYSWECDIGVEWETKPAAGHGCNGHCKNPYGRYVPHTTIMFANQDYGEIETASTDELFGMFL